MGERSKLTTLCYIEKDDSYLMLHRVSKKNDENKDKWIGIGGHFEEGESPEDCLLREAKEETGLTLTSWKFRGIPGPFDRPVIKTMIPDPVSSSPLSLKV